MTEYITADGRHRYPVATPIWRCPETGAPVDLTPAPGITRDRFRADDFSVWRYRDTIRVNPDFRVELGEGWTPLIPVDLPADLPAGRARLKLESLMPSGSFKDRGMAVLVAYLRERGVDRVMLDSSGNAAGALACYAGAAGIGCTVLVPAHTSPAKVAQMRAYGAEVRLIGGSRQDVADAAMALAAEGVFYASHNWQPFFIEGTKTLAYEIWEQSGFRLPDNIVIPVGYGSNLMGLHLGFKELMAAGEIDAMPRLFAAQPANVGALVRAVEAGVSEPVAFTPKPTVAEGVAAAKLVRTAACVAAIRESGGGAVAVPEETILPAVRALAARGALVEPSCAVAAVAFERLVADGTITADQDSVLIMTGNGLKSLDALMEEKQP